MYNQSWSLLQPFDCLNSIPKMATATPYLPINVAVVELLPFFIEVATVMKFIGMPMADLAKGNSKAIKAAYWGFIAKMVDFDTAIVVAVHRPKTKKWNR